MGECGVLGRPKIGPLLTVILKIHDRMAMLRREILTLSILAERFIFARKISVANLSSQTRDMASS